MLASLALAVGLMQPADSLSLAAALRLAAERGAATIAAAAAERARQEARLDAAIPNPTARWSYTDAAPKGHASVEQPLDWLLTRGAARSAGRFAVAARVADSAQVAADLAAQVRSAYYAAVRAEAGVRSASELQVIADSLVWIADRRLAAGDIALADRDQVQLDAARARLALRAAEQARASSRAQLAGALGLAALDPGVALSDRLDDGFTASDPEPRRLDPALEATVLDSAATAARRALAAKARFPFPALELGVEWNDPSVDRQPLALIGLSVPLPLFQRGGPERGMARADQDAANGRLREARAALAAAEASVRVDLSATANRAATIRDSVLPAARVARARATRAYQAGEIGMLPVLDALRTERQTSDDLLDALLAWQRARAEWLRLHRSVR